MTTKNHVDATTVHLGATVAASDPGAQNGRKLWVDTSAGPPYQLKLRNAADLGWDEVGLDIGTGWQGVWSGATTYAKNAVVTGSDNHVYLSIAAANLNHNPVGDSNVHWQALNA